MQLDLSTPRGCVHFHRGPWQEMRLPDRYVVIGDPPYGDNYESGWKLGHDRDGSDPGARTLAPSIDGDLDTTERDSFLERGGWVAAAVYGPSVTKVLTVPELRPWGKPTAVLVVDKGGGAGGLGDLSFPWKTGNTETIAIYGEGWSGRRTSSVLQSRVMSIGRGSAANGRRHPNEKDLANVVELVSKAPRGLPIVDPWGGSGPTAEACALLGRTCWIAEKNPLYWPVIEGRCAASGADLRSR